MLKFNWHNISIMVVDDNSFMRSLITSTIRTLGIKEVVSVPSATQAIELLKDSKTDPVNSEIGSIDIILSDFVMPDVDGILFLRWTRTNKQAPDRFVPFIMVSGQADEKGVENSRDAGMTEFLAKPFAAQTVADRLLEVIRNPRQFILAPGYFATPTDSPLWWSVIFGANLGGNLTPIGSASTLVAVTIMHKHGVGVSFARFVVLALPYALVHIVLATAYVLAFLA